MNNHHQVSSLGQVVKKFNGLIDTKMLASHRPGSSTSTTSTTTSSSSSTNWDKENEGRSSASSTAPIDIPTSRSQRMRTSTSESTFWTKKPPTAAHVTQQPQGSTRSVDPPNPHHQAHQPQRHFHQQRYHLSPTYTEGESSCTSTRLGHSVAPIAMPETWPGIPWLPFARRVIDPIAPRYHEPLHDPGFCYRLNHRMKGSGKREDHELLAMGLETLEQNGRKRCPAVRIHVHTSFPMKFTLKLGPRKQSLLLPSLTSSKGSTFSACYHWKDQSYPAGCRGHSVQLNRCMNYPEKKGERNVTSSTLSSSTLCSCCSTFFSSFTCSSPPYPLTLKPPLSSAPPSFSSHFFTSCSSSVPSLVPAVSSNRNLLVADDADVDISCSSISSTSSSSSSTTTIISLSDSCLVHSNLHHPNHHLLRPHSNGKNLLHTDPPIIPSPVDVPDLLVPPVLFPPSPSPSLPSPATSDDRCPKCCTSLLSPETLSSYLEVSDTDFVTAQIATQIEAGIKRAKSTSVLDCCEVLIPLNLTRQIGQDVVNTSESEPCGLRGCVLYLNLQDESGEIRRIGAIRPVGANPVHTFELYLTLKQASTGWLNAVSNKLFKTFGKRSIVISENYQLSKKKLYRQ